MMDLITTAHLSVAPSNPRITSGNASLWPEDIDLKDFQPSDRPLGFRKRRSRANRYHRNSLTALDGDLRARRKDARALLKSP